MQVGGKVVGSSSSNSSIVVEVIVIVVVLYLVRLQKHRAHGVFFFSFGCYTNYHKKFNALSKNIIYIYNNFPIRFMQYFSFVHQEDRES